VNAFVIAATALMLLLAPLGVVTVLRRPIDGLVALSLAGTLSALAILCLAEGLHRSFVYTVAVIAAVMSALGRLVYARFLGRWL
jgi:multisubunit Na+/H+ antiporter MnhF subunit